MNEKRERFKKEYPVFRYVSYDIEERSDEIALSWRFSVDGLCDFYPETRIKTDNLAVLNAPDSPLGRRLVFLMGMVELVSYLKATLSPRVIIECGALSASEAGFYKDLWYDGLGEFFYKNGLDETPEGFTSLEYEPAEPEVFGPVARGKISDLIPVGGGKDSAVTAQLTKEFFDSNFFITVNDQKARTDTVLASGYSSDRIVRVYRKISPELLELNARGFFNGHTPFSAIVAMISSYAAYLVGAENIILSNEASANEGNIGGAGVNHQFSKSFAFERGFNESVLAPLGGFARYFSILRPFNELQIAAYFSRFPQYLPVFRSCNKGSKKNEWCCGCAKCLFVYSMLSPFVPEAELTAAFGKNMFTVGSEADDLDGLTGVSEVKPFECVGTASEVCAALKETCRVYGREGRELPVLLRRFADGPAYISAPDIREKLGYFNDEHLIPPKYMSAVRGMYEAVRSAVK